MYKHILIPIDGSACSEQAAVQGLTLAKIFGAKITFLYVLENPVLVYATPDIVPYYARELLDDLRKHAEEVLLAAQAPAKEAGLEADTSLLEFMRPADGIIQAAQDCDLVVMGSHGRSGIRRLLLGSVTEAVMRLSSKPLLVMRCLERAGAQPSLRKEGDPDAKRARPP